MLRRIFRSVLVVLAACVPQTDGAIDAERLLSADARLEPGLRGRTFAHVGALAPVRAMYGLVKPNERFRSKPPGASI